jgi:hypothetical protein
VLTLSEAVVRESLLGHPDLAIVIAQHEAALHSALQPVGRLEALRGGANSVRISFALHTARMKGLLQWILGFSKS